MLPKRTFTSIPNVFSRTRAPTPNEKQRNRKGGNTNAFARVWGKHNNYKPAQVPIQVQINRLVRNKLHGGMAPHHKQKTKKKRKKKQRRKILLSQFNFSFLARTTAVGRGRTQTTGIGMSHARIQRSQDTKVPEGKHPSDMYLPQHSITFTSIPYRHD